MIRTSGVRAGSGADRDPRAVNRVLLHGLARSVALIERVPPDQVHVTEHSPGQIVVRVEGVADDRFVSVVVVQADRGDQMMPDAARSGPGDDDG